MDVLKLMITLLAAFLAMLFIAGLVVRRAPAGTRVLSLLTIALFEGSLGIILMVLYHLEYCSPNNDFCPSGYFYLALGLGTLATVTTFILTLTSVASLVRVHAWRKGLLVLAHTGEGLLE